MVFAFKFKRIIENLQIIRLFWGSNLYIRCINYAVNLNMFQTSQFKTFLNIKINGSNVYLCFCILQAHSLGSR